MHEVWIFLAGLFLGGVIGVVIMCLMQVCGDEA